MCSCFIQNQEQVSNNEATTFIFDIALLLLSLLVPQLFNDSDIMSLSHPEAHTLTAIDTPLITNPFSQTHPESHTLTDIDTNKTTHPYSYRHIQNHPPLQLQTHPPFQLDTSTFQLDTPTLSAIDTNKITHPYSYRHTQNHPPLTAIHIQNHPPLQLQTHQQSSTLTCHFIALFVLK